MSATSSFPGFSAQVREFMRVSMDAGWTAGGNGGSNPEAHPQKSCSLDRFDGLARELFALQYRHNAAYRRLCEARGVTPQAVEHWSQIPSVPTAAFKELELSCLPAEQRSAVFYSSGTTEHRPSHHFHSAQSLALYDASALPWFTQHLMAGMKERVFMNGVGTASSPVPMCNCCGKRGDEAVPAPTLRLQEYALGVEPHAQPTMVILTPAQAEVPHSSLVHMFETVRRELGSEHSTFLGTVDADGVWTLDAAAVVDALAGETRAGRPVVLLGTAFLFVHLLDYLAGRRIRLELPPGSRVLETGGYKGRSRTLPKAELHALITEQFGIPERQIICEYGMSELSSQAYDRVAGNATDSPPGRRCFHFPPWARAQIISPETGREVNDGETGLIRVLDLANAFSVMAVQTEDLGIRRGDGFELIGRAALAEARGCSLMAL